MNFSDLDRAIRKEKIAKVVSFFRSNGDKFSAEQYSQLGNIERLKLISETIEAISPGYRQKYYELEAKKPAEKRIRIPAEFNLKDVVDSAEGEETTEKGLEIFYINRLAHMCRDAQRRMVYELLRDYNKKYANYPSVTFNLQDRKNIDRMILDLHRYFIAETRGNVVGLRILQKELGRAGIYQSDIEDLRKQGYGVLAQGYVNCMELKDKAIKEEIELLKDDDTQSYGVKTVIDEKGDTNHLFVFDIPCFGQMSVHIYEEDLISRLSDNEYKWPIYQRDNILLTEYASQFQEEFMLENAEDLVNALASLKNKKDAHEIAVKAGFTKDEISQVHHQSTDEKGDAR